MTQEYFQSSFNYKVKNKLYMKDFWATDPCNWTMTNYLSKLVAEDPTVSRRNASNRLISDATIVRKHVVAGTIAETMSSAMLSFKQSARAKEAFTTFFVSHASQISQESLKYGVQKTRLRSVMAEQVVDLEEKENDRKRKAESKYEDDADNSVRTSKRREITVIDDNQSNEQDSDDGQKISIWEEWKQFLNNEVNKKNLMQLSPEMHNVIWCGKLVRRRTCLPPELYAKLNQEVSSVTIQDISPCLAEMCMAIFDAESNIEMQSCVEKLSHTVLSDPILVAEKRLIIDICGTFNDYIYDNCGTDMLQKSESCYRSYLIDSCMKAATKYMRNNHHNVTFFPGEIELDAMTVQLKQNGMNDRRYKYNADGVLKADDLSLSEILLTEVSSGYGSTDAGKISFDHYKAMFGMLAMLRTLAQLYDKASFKTFAKLKIHFIHAHGQSIRHWSMSTKAPGIYVMNKEQRVDVPVRFSDKDVTLLPFICFFKTLAVACTETLSVLKELKKDHKAILRSKDKERVSLCNIVDPVIIRLNEGKHAGIVAEHGPMSIPSSPIHNISPENATSILYFDIPSSWPEFLCSVLGEADWMEIFFNLPKKLDKSYYCFYNLARKA